MSNFDIKEWVTKSKPSKWSSKTKTTTTRTMRPQRPPPAGTTAADRTRLKLQGVYTTDDRLIPLAMIESIHRPKDDADAIVNKLKDDITIEIVTVSGREYQVSLKQTLESLGPYPGDPATHQELYNDLIISWYAHLKK